LGVYSSFDLQLLPSSLLPSSSSSSTEDSSSSSSTATTNEDIINKEEEEEGARVRFILLDTRSFRDSHFVRSVGEFQIPFSALFAAVLRTLSALLRLGRTHPGDVLGDMQWKWLEAQLRDDPAPFTVLVSSIQVLTSNPAVESWGHFPVAKQRLMDLLGKYQPSGLLILSGDVHYAETLAMKIDLHESAAAEEKEEKEEVEVVESQTSSTTNSFLVHEVTSSGLTHSCTSPWLTRRACPMAVGLYSQFRYPSPAHVFTGRNYGTLRLLTSGNQNSNSNSNHNISTNADSHSRSRLQVTIYSMESHKPVLSHMVYPSNITLSDTHSSSTRTKEGNSCRHVSYPDSFFSLSEEMAINVIITGLLFVAFFIVLFVRFFRYLTRL